MKLESRKVATGLVQGGSRNMLAFSTRAEIASAPAKGAPVAVEGASVPAKGAPVAVEGASVPAKGAPVAVEGASVPTE
jgi:hypothetical protein